MTAKGRTPLWGASLSWQSLNVLLQVILQLVYIRILAELLTQEDFGIMAIALIVVGVVEIFAQVGIGPSVVQFNDLEPKHIASAWWFRTVPTLHATAQQLRLRFRYPSYLQSFRYFEDEPSVSMLRARLRFLPAILERAQGLRANATVGVREAVLVGIHVRYRGRTHSGKQHVAPASYYQSAMSRFRERYGDRARFEAAQRARSP